LTSPFETRNSRLPVEQEMQKSHPVTAVDEAPAGPEPTAPFAARFEQVPAGSRGARQYFGRARH
jgi:hypothetical protein